MPAYKGNTTKPMEGGPKKRGHESVECEPGKESVEGCSATKDRTVDVPP